MLINDTQINADLSDILDELKLQLESNGVSRFYKMFDTGSDIMVCCPYHKDGQERKPSAGIRKSDGLLHCLACDKTVGLDEMVANCFGRSDPAWGYRWIIQNFALVSAEERKDILYDLTRGQQSTNVTLYVSEDELDSYRYTHPYMYKRGLTDHTIELFDLGYDKKTDSITFPVRDAQGDCLFVARRNVAFKRFDMPKGIEKPLYGLYEIHQSTSIPEVYVCEGLFDCLRLWSLGKFAVAGFGCLFSEFQIKQLQELPTRKLILALDNDRAGKEAAKKLKGRIKNKLVTQAVIPIDKKDVGELTDEEIQNLREEY